MITIETTTARFGNKCGIVVPEAILNRMKALASGSRLIFSVDERGGASVRVKEPDAESDDTLSREKRLRALSSYSWAWDCFGDTPEEIEKELRKGSKNKEFAEW